MGLHKLTAGDGYMYLIRQVAAADSTGRGRGSLTDYYSAKGEAPGTWMGRGLVVAVVSSSGVMRRVLGYAVCRGGRGGGGRR